MQAWLQVYKFQKLAKSTYGVETQGSGHPWEAGVPEGTREASIVMAPLFLSACWLCRYINFVKIHHLYTCDKLFAYVLKMKYKFYLQNSVYHSSVGRTTQNTVYLKLMCYLLLSLLSSLPLYTCVLFHLWHTGVHYFGSFLKKPINLKMMFKLLDWFLKQKFYLCHKYNFLRERERDGAIFQCHLNF